MFNISHKKRSCFIKKFKKSNLIDISGRSSENFRHKHLTLIVAKILILAGFHTSDMGNDGSNQENFPWDGEDAFC